MSVKDEGKEAYDRVAKELKRFQKLTVRVGYQNVGNTDLAIIDIALFHEFGTINIPARPFFSSAIENGKGAILDQIEKEVTDIVNDKSTALKSANRLGLFAKNLIQERIRTSPAWAEALQASTIERKGSSVPLIDTGELLNSVTYAVIEGSTVIASG